MKIYLDRLKELALTENISTNIQRNTIWYEGIGIGVDNKELSVRYKTNGKVSDNDICISYPLSYFEFKYAREIFIGCLAKIDHETKVKRKATEEERLKNNLDRLKSVLWKE